VRQFLQNADHSLKSLKTILETIGIDSDVPGEIMIAGPAGLSDAGSDHLTFLANLKYEAELYTTKAAAVLVPRDFRPRKEIAAQLIPVDDPYMVITRILELFSESMDETGIREPVSIGANVALPETVYIGEFSRIGDHCSIGDQTRIYPQVFIGSSVTIGRNTIIYPGVKIYHGCVIGDNCIIHANTVIGSDGFGFAPGESGRFRKIPQIGNVVIKDDVEIGSSCTIDRATMGSTVIGNGVKLDNLIMVGHNVVIGDRTVIAAQTGISGSTQIGEQSMIGGQVGLAGHLSIAPGTKINAKSGVAKSVRESGAKLNGIPAFNFFDSLRSQSVYRKLPDLEKKVKEIEEILSLLRK
jgi:UDP-3-O-[3-hydroxymyristoyl] glucosamine N-acyltransferase